MNMKIFLSKFRLNSKIIIWTLFLFMPAMLCGFLRTADQNFSYVDLIQRLTNLECLAILPEAGEQCAQWSSCDRFSRYDEFTGKYLNWSANGDGTGIIRTENGKSVLAEMKGPGCIWRIWSADPKSGHEAIYLDGSPEPAVDLPFSGYFDKKNPPFNRASLVHDTSSGKNNYTPISYQKSCKIVADPGWGLYYQIDYSTYPDGIQVPSFKMELSSNENLALDNVDQVLGKCGPRMDENEPMIKGKVGDLQTNGWIETANIEGPGAITSIRMRTSLPPSPADIDALRSLTIQIKWDGESEPSVWSPLGDFFGTAPGANVYSSFPSGLTKDGWWYCNWFMPFSKKAEITIKKEGNIPVDLEYQINSKPLKNDFSRLARFHAKWHKDAFLPVESERWIDWPMLKTEGRGRFVGVMLHVWNPRGGWWGEGDEKFFVDGEKFPSTFGTGSEDYFGYAWCNPSLFQNAYHNQTHNDGNNQGHISVNRWQIQDNIPFQSSFEGSIEKYFSNKRCTFYASTVFWYLETGGKDPYLPLPLSERIGYWTNSINNPNISGDLLKETSSLSSWLTFADKESQIDLITEKNKSDDILAIVFNLSGGNWVSIEESEMRDLRKYTGIRFKFRDSGIKGNIEFKIIDNDGSTFMTYIKERSDKDNWKTASVFFNDLDYGWGGDAKLDLSGVKLSFAVSKGQGGDSGSGKLEIGTIEVLK